MKTLLYPIYFLMLIVFLSCAGTKEPLLKTPDGSTWQLEYISGLQMDITGLYPEKRPTISFNNNTMTLHGYTGCNNFSVSFESTGNSLKLSDNGKQTMRACPGPGEPHFMRQLEAADSFEVTSNGLFLYGKGIPLMRFKKKNKK